MADVGTRMTPRLAYIIGFVLSLLLTGEAFLMVTRQVFVGQHLVYALAALALTQLVVQLVFFLHLGQDETTRWNSFFLLSTISIIVIVMVGSIWIVQNLNERMMSPAQINSYTQNQDGF